jgi:hypothetical protein
VQSFSSGPGRVVGAIAFDKEDEIIVQAATFLIFGVNKHNREGNMNQVGFGLASQD